MHIKLLILSIVLAFVAPVVYHRTRYRFWPRKFEKINFLRYKTKLNIHHGHFGLLIVILLGAWNALGTRNDWTTIGFFLGLGLLVDEIIPSLMMPSNDRKKELECYRDSLSPTLILTAVLAIVITACLLMLKG